MRESDTSPQTEKRAISAAMSLPLDRDAVLAAFRADPERALKAKDVSSFLELPADDRSALRAMLYVLVDEGDLVQLPGRRFALASHSLVLEGQVSRTLRGFGWFIADAAGQKDGFIEPEALAGLLDGDRVCARLEASPRGPVAKITKVISRSRSLVTGELHRRGGSAWVECPKEVLGTPVMLPPGDEGRADDIAEGSVVEVVITQYPTHVTSAMGRVVRVIGKAGELSVEIDRIVTDAGIPRPFSPETLGEASSLPSVPAPEDHKGREDLRAIPLCTIDGETAKDFDDAVYGRMEGKDFLLLVAIADVSHYVRPGSALDEDATIRGTSVYFPGSVIPMLPEALSNGLCSLNPHVERLCLCAELLVNARGQVKRSRFFEGLMQSHARLTYTKVWKYLEGDKQLAAQIPAAVQDSLQVLRKAARALRAMRQRRGSMDFELPETVIEVDERGVPRKLFPLERNEAHKLIEDLMLAANEAVAERFMSKGLPAIYRVHEPPNLEKVERFLRLARVIAQEQGVRPPPEKKGHVPSSKDIRAILEPLSDSPLRRVLDFLLLRAMMQARYSADNLGHYSLSSDAYTHFTSPIRRYPDLVVHRLLRDHIRHPRYQPSEQEAEAKTNALEDLAARCSDAERRATVTERAIDALMATWIMRDKVGEELEGAVSGCAEFGAFVRLFEPYVEGMVPVATIANEFLEYDELRMRLYGRSGFEIGVGDRVLVSVDAVDVAKRQVALRLVKITEQHGKSVEIFATKGREDHPWDRFLARQGKKTREQAGPRSGGGRQERKGGGRGSKPGGKKGGKGRR